MKEKGDELMRKLTPMRAIRAKCLDCSAGSFNEVRECPVIKCPLHAYRSGHRPKGEQFTIEGLEIEKS